MAEEEERICRNWLCEALLSSACGPGFKGLSHPQVGGKQCGGQEAFVILITFTWKAPGDRHFGLDLEWGGAFPCWEGQHPHPATAFSIAPFQGWFPHGPRSSGAATWLNRTKYPGKASATAAMALTDPAKGSVHPVPTRTGTALGTALLHSALTRGQTPHMNQTRPDETLLSELPQQDGQDLWPNRKATLNGCRWWPSTATHQGAPYPTLSPDPLILGSGKQLRCTHSDVGCKKGLRSCS